MIDFMIGFCKLFLKEFKNKKTNDDMIGSFKCFWLILFCVGLLTFISGVAILIAIDK